MLVRRQVAFTIGLLPCHISYLPLFDLAGGDNAIFGLLYFCFSLVELGLEVSALLHSGVLCLLLRKGLELRRQFWVKLQEGVQVATEYDLVLGQVSLQQKQVCLELLYLFCVFLFFGAKMCAYEDEVIGASNRKTLSPLFYLLSFFSISYKIANILEGDDLFKGVLVDHNQSISFIINYDCFILKAFDFL